MKIGSLKIIKGPSYNGRFHTRWYAIYWNKHCVSIAPTKYFWTLLWKD